MEVAIINMNAMVGGRDVEINISKCKVLCMNDNGKKLSEICMQQNKCGKRVFGEEGYT